MTAKKLTEQWARLHLDWYQDPVLCTIAEQQPAVMQLWPILICMAKSSSHYQRNPNGEIKTTLRTLSTNAFLDVNVIEQCLELLVEGEMLTVDKSPYGLTILTAGFSKWQTPCGGTAERSANHRWNKERAATSASREKAAGRDGNERSCNECATSSNDGVTVTRCETCIEGEGEGEGDRENHHHLSSSSLNTASVVAHPEPDDDDVFSEEKTNTVFNLDPTRSPTAHVAQTRSKLGKSALLVDELVAQRVEHRGGKPMSPAEQYRKWYAPALELVTLFGPRVADEALAAAVTRRATSITYARSVAAGIVDKNQRDDRTGNAKGMIAGPNRHVSVEELEKLMAEGLA